MHLIPLFTAAVMALTTAQGATLTFTDPFNVPGDSDTIGDKLAFDVERLVLTIDPTLITIHVLENYGNSTLSQTLFNTTKLDAGDILIKENGTFKWGIPLHDHAGSPNGGAFATGGTVTAGHIYQILDPTAGVMTARQALNDPPYTYRPDEFVWLRSIAASLVDLTTGASGVTVTPIAGNNGTNGPLYDISLSFTRPAGFITGANTYDVLYSTADCANDVLNGTFAGAGAGGGPVPEPASLALGGFGLLALLFVRRVRK
jgi:hypothetical protein